MCTARLPTVSCGIGVEVGGLGLPTLPGHRHLSGHTPWTHSPSLPRRDLGPEIPPPPWPDRHLWKHYLPGSSFEGGNKIDSTFLSRTTSLAQIVVSFYLCHWFIFIDIVHYQKVVHGVSTGRDWTRRVKIHAESVSVSVCVTPGYCADNSFGTI